MSLSTALINIGIVILLQAPEPLKIFQMSINIFLRWIIIFDPVKWELFRVRNLHV